MDKTYNDLMSIVNRTKKVGGGSDIPKVTRRVRREETFEDEPLDEAVIETVVEGRKPVRDLEPESKPSLFAGKDAINKFLNTPKTKKKTTTKTKKSEDKEKTTTKKSAEKKSSTKKSTTKKDSSVLPQSTSIDYNDPKNAQLLDALKDTLFAGGTDISDYVDDDKFENTANTLKALKEKKKTEIINEEITKEQQEYEKLFTGSFFSEEDVKTGEEEEEDPEDVLESALIGKKPDNSRHAVKEKRLDSELEELKSRDMEIDRKIADYYKQKQEKINKYNEALYNDAPVEEKVDAYEDKQRSYEDVFSGSVMSRAELMGEKVEDNAEEEIEETETATQEATDVETTTQIVESDDIVENNVEESTEETNDTQIDESESKDTTESQEDQSEDEETEDTVSEASEQNEENETQLEDKDSKMDVVSRMFAFSEAIKKSKQDAEIIVEESKENLEDNQEQSVVDTEEVIEEDSIEKPQETETQAVDESTIDSSEQLEQSDIVQLEEIKEEEIQEDSETQETKQEASEVNEEKSDAEAYESLFTSGLTSEEEDESNGTVEEITESSQKVEEPAEEKSEQTESINTEETAVIEQTQSEPEIIEEAPVIDEEVDDNNANAFVESVEENIYGDDDDYSNYDDEELDRMSLNRKQTFTDDDIAKFEQEDAELKVSMDDLYDLSQDDELGDYIVSSNVPDEIVEEESPMQEYIEEDNSLVLDTRALPESQIDVLGQEIETPKEEKQEIETTQEDTKEPEEETDSISKKEFYNEMARLQQNLINELKGQKVETESRDFFEEKKPEPVVQVQPQPQPQVVQANPDNSTINKALDIINNLTNKPVVESEQTEDKLNKPAEQVEPAQVSAEAQEQPVEKVEEPQLVEEEKIDPELQEKFDSMDLLNKDVSLNDQDLQFFNESQKPKDLEKDAYFYNSDEDKNKKAEFEDEYLTMYNEEESGHNVEVGDINLNKNIQNAVPLSEMFKNSIKESGEKTEQDTEEEIETIYTLFGMERKKMGKQKEDIKVLYVASECQPFIATGGLADVAGSLPKAVAELGGVDIRVVLPLYGNIKSEYRDKFEYLGNFTVHLSWRQEYCGLFRYSKDGVTYYFIDNERYFKRDKTYGYYDDGERFAYFCKAIVESLPIINFFPDIIHCNDWQSSLVSAYIKTGNWSDYRYYQIKNIYTIHNVEYQGVYGMENLKDLFGIDYRFRNDMDYNGDINLTKAAIQYSDKFTTVSESYCDNLKQPYCSRGLHHIIIRNDYKLSGIINGIDYDFYNPETDKIIYKNYNVETLKDKVMNKKIWQDELGLPVDARTPMLAIVSRLVSHKGLDLLSKVIEDVLQKDVQLVVVGTGDQRFVDYYKYLESKYPTKVRAMVDAFSSELARKAYAASDIFLMPSKIEPCGISQMIASRYGSIPVVREVGGLKDSIKDFGCESGGNGYTFTNYNPNDLSYQINRAIEDYEDQANWEKKMKIAMTTDFRWSKSAEKYIELYKSLV